MIHQDFMNARHAALPAPIDSETRVLLYSFLSPILETAESWSDLRAKLAAKGYDVTFRAGRMVLTRADSGVAVCTGRAMGTPLRSLAARIGRPCIKVNADGVSGDLSCARDMS